MLIAELSKEDGFSECIEEAMTVFKDAMDGLEKENIVVYSCTNYRHKKGERGIRWNDKNLKIDWPINNPILSKRDK